MTSVRIKICGITNAQDALDAVNAGADYLGLIFVPGTPRALSVEQAQTVVQAVRENDRAIRVVGVFQNESQVVVEERIRALRLDLVQLHGDEPPAFCEALSVPVIKTVLLNGNMERIFSTMQPYQTLPILHALLLDLPKGSQGQISDVMTPEFFQSVQNAPVLLAGRLTTENVASVVNRFQPWGVDVASGVELAPGKKCPEKMRAFCSAVRTPSFDQKETP